MVEYVVYDAKTLEKARKKAGRREWIHDKYQKIVNGVMSNKEFFMIVVPIGTATIGAVAKGAKAIGKKQSLKKVVWEIPHLLLRVCWRLQIPQAFLNSLLLGTILMTYIIICMIHLCLFRHYIICLPQLLLMG